MIETFSALHPYEQIGMAGFALYIGVFSAVTLRWLNADTILFFVLSMGSALMILTGLQISFNMAAAYMQAFKVAMCTVGIGLRLWRAKAKAAEDVSFLNIDFNRPAR